MQQEYDYIPQKNWKKLKGDKFLPPNWYIVTSIYYQTFYFLTNNFLIIGLQQSSWLVGIGRFDLWNGSWISAILCWSTNSDIWKNCFWKSKEKIRFCPKNSMASLSFFKLQTTLWLQKNKTGGKRPPLYVKCYMQSVSRKLFKHFFINAWWNVVGMVELI